MNSVDEMKKYLEDRICEIDGTIEKLRVKGKRNYVSESSASVLKEALAKHNELCAKLYGVPIIDVRMNKNNPFACGNCNFFSPIRQCRLVGHLTTKYLCVVDEKCPVDWSVK